MDVLLWIVFGVVVGIVWYPDRSLTSILFSIALGIVGALIGGWLGRIFGGEAGGNVLAIGGAAMLLVLIRMVLFPRFGRR